MKIEFEVPDGEYCLNCSHQENFGVEEIIFTGLGDINPRYEREIVANCHLFNQPIYGVHVDEMRKCTSCRKDAKC